MSAENSETEKLRGIVEAVLMTAGQPVSPGKLTSLCKGASGKDLRRVVDELNQLYAAGDHVMTITEVAGGFQFVTRKEFGPWVRKFHDRSQVRVSQAALDTRDHRLQAACHSHRGGQHPRRRFWRGHPYASGIEHDPNRR